MYSTSTGIKKSFYSQTGNFQFQADLSVDSLLGGVNLGVSGLKSGNIPTVINYFCNSGKIFDNNNKFVGAYTPDEIFSISGNIKSGRYDYFINNNPISYNNYKDTGTYNYFYINPNYISCDYDLYINGEQPNLSVTNITCFSGDYAGTGYIINNSLPLIIYSGEYSNFSTNLPFGYSDIFTGQLNIGESGAFYIYPNSGESVGLYTGKMNLFTNGGTLFHNTVINITASPVNTNDYNFNLNGLNYIVQNNTQLYTSDIEALFGSGIPIVVSLEYYSGSGNFYTNIDIVSGFSRQISGYIFNSGYLISGNSVTGIGTGSGGYLNNIATGFVSGYFSGNLQYATGSFTWPYSLNVTGYRTGINYSGKASGFHNMIVSQTIYSGSGTYNYSGLLTGNSAQNLYNVSGTGFIYPTGKIYFGVPVASDLVSITAVNPGFPSMNASFQSTYYNIDDLVDLINASNIATGFKDTSTTIMITGLYPDSITQQTLLTIDPFNVGTMSVSDYYLVGSVDLGVGESVFSDNLPVTGYIANYKFTGSGVYYQNISGYISGSGNVIDYTKTFTGSWNLFTGRGENKVNYYSGGLYNIEKNKYLDTGHPVYYTNSTAIINVEYINPYDSLSDIAILKVSGLNLNTGISLYITGLAG